MHPEQTCSNSPSHYPQIDISNLHDSTTLCVGVLPKSGQFHITLGDTLFMSGIIETHDPLQECSEEFNEDSRNLGDGEKVLEFYQLLSQSNRIIKTCDLEDLSCEIATEKYANSASTANGNLILLDCHFQLIQVCAYYFSYHFHHIYLLPN
jgi:hypothetical protein